MTTATQYGLAPKPDHVPESIVHDFDFIRGEDYLGDPYACADDIISSAPPVFWTPRNRGHWVIVNYNLVYGASKDWEKFSNHILPPEVVAAMTAKLPPGAASPLSAVPSSLDPPEHSVYREPISAAFTPKIASSLKEEIRALAGELFDEVRPKGACSLMEDVTKILPVKMFLKLFGLPVEKNRHYRSVVESMSSNTSLQDFEQIVRNTTVLVNTFTDDMVARRDNPGDDLLSKLWQMEINGQPMTLETMQSFGITLFLAGLDTVTNAMALGTRHFAENPDLQERVRADRTLIPQVTEELLRLYSISLPIRTVARDCEFAGVQMKKGEQVHFFHAAANRDAAAFANPREFSIDRPGKTHLSFGSGPHRCLGMHLARVELHVYYEELLKRLPPFRLDPDKTTHFHGGVTMGPNEVYLRWD